MHASIDTTFWKRQTIGLETISGSQAGGVTTKGKNEGVFGDEGTVLCSILVVLSQLYVFVKAHRAKIILFYVNKKIRKKKKKTDHRNIISSTLIPLSQTTRSKELLGDERKCCRERCDFRHTRY